MPRVLGYTPAWLSRGSPGFDLFAPGVNEKEPQDAHSTPPSNLPLRTIAHSATEIFVAVGEELRWAELVNVKELADIHGANAGPNSAFKVLDIKRVGGDIKQLILSPNGEYLAVVRSHTIQIVQIPNSEYLEDEKIKIKPRKVYQLGLFDHVYSESPIACVLWHPLGVGGQCLVTITQSAVLRLWEIDFDNRASFELPALELDLTVLADATSARDDLKGSGYKKNKYFSAYSPEFEPVAACFGGTDRTGENPWSAMTLWIAMKEGDVYALCPLLPKRWQASERLVNSAMFIASARAYDAADGNEDLVQWGKELANQEPLQLRKNTQFGKSDARSIYARPRAPDEIPVLQGPFIVTPEQREWDPEISDIFVVDIGASASEPDHDLDSLDSYDESDEELVPDSSSSVVSLLTISGQVTVTLCLEGVEPSWLSSDPSSPANANGFDEDRTDRQLLALRSSATLLQGPTGPTHRPLFTPDALSSFAFFVTDDRGISYVSLSTLINSLREELQTSSGSSFRIATLLDSSEPFVENILSFPTHPAAKVITTSASVVVRDTDLGYLLLSAQNGEPYAAEMDIRSPQAATATSQDVIIKQEQFDDDVRLDNSLTRSLNALTFSAQREPYRPDPAFYTASNGFLEIKRNQHPGQLQKQVRLSNETLGVITQCHRLLSEETEGISRAAADLFRKCEVLLKEFRDQVSKVGEIRGKVDDLADGSPDQHDDADDGEDDQSTTPGISRRLERIMDRQKELYQRRTRLLGKVTRAQNGIGGLSDKEKAWKDEILSTAARFSLDSPQSRETDSGKQAQAGTADVSKRLDTLRQLKVQLLTDEKKLASDISAKQTAEGDSKPSPGGFGSPRGANRFKKQREQQVLDLLERETALIEGVMERLSRLTARG